jgi:hypothetical protein
LIFLVDFCFLVDFLVDFVKKNKKKKSKMQKTTVQIKDISNSDNNKNPSKFDNTKRTLSLGYFSVLDDDLLIEVLEWFDEKSLLNLSLVSHVFYIFSDEEELVTFNFLFANLYLFFSF